MKLESISQLIEQVIILELERIIKNKSKVSLPLIKLIELYLKQNKLEISNEQIKKIIEDLIK
ncbi:MAG: hypothetical protein QW156_03880 [Candidatus Aenigmatarchaeota archaeon]